MKRAELMTMFRTMATEITEKDYSHVQEESVIADIGIDSLGMLELVGSMERELQITIPDERLVGLQTIAELLEVVEKQVATAQAQ